jgi:hypothetical protein
MQTKERIRQLTDVKKEVVSEGAKPKLTQREKNKIIMELSKEVNRNIALRTFKDWLGA